MELSEIRRINTIEIMKENALDETSLSLCLGKDEALIESMLQEGSAKKINDSLARLIEQTFSKSKLWLDGDSLSDETGPSFDLFG